MNRFHNVFLATNGRFECCDCDPGVEQTGSCVQIAQMAGASLPNTSCDSPSIHAGTAPEHVSS